MAGDGGSSNSSSSTIYIIIAVVVVVVVIALLVGYYIYRRRAEWAKYFSKGGDVDEDLNHGEVIPESEGDAVWLSPAALSAGQQEQLRGPAYFRMQSNYNENDPFEEESASSAYNPGEVGTRSGFNKKKSDLVFIM